MHSFQCGLLCALHFTEEDFSLTLTLEFLRRMGGQSQSMPRVQVAGFCVYSKPSLLLTECLADFILWGFWDVFVRRALLLTLAAVATFWELKRIPHTVCVFPQQKDSWQLLEMPCPLAARLSPAPWPLSSLRITEFQFCKVPFAVLWCTKGTWQCCRGFELVIFVMLRKLERVTGLDHVFIYSTLALLGFRGSLPWRRSLSLAVYILRWLIYVRWRGKIAS